ncbi:hypothetical protein M422DRAFT_241239 [Sphaerobolus stellatus SS14]|nr:hypothetical protein M422DRAFT_241239 [Sphaerobolus stellatus SS14]
MLFKTFLATSLAIVALAIPTPQDCDDNGYGGEGGTTTIEQCNTGTLSCCQSVSSVDESGLSPDLLTGLLGALGPVPILLGLGCTPVTVIGATQGASCSQQPACCSGDSSGDGLVTANCSPISL